VYPRRLAGPLRVDEVLNLIGTPNLKPYATLLGHEVRLTTLKLRSFKANGITCAACGVAGAAFFVEKTLPKEPPYLNLYTADNILMTRDHVVAIADGGKDTIDNSQTMCSPCNCAKDSEAHKNYVRDSMSYQHIQNLYREQTILLFKECFAMEKIHGCVKKGTLVHMANGTEVPIEQIKRGDKVLSYSTEKQKFVTATVENLVVQERNVRLGWMEVTLQDGRSVICTEDHPFFTKNRGWVAASALTADDDILTPGDK
jgi:hypothetical protein